MEVEERRKKEIRKNEESVRRVIEMEVEERRKEKRKIRRIRKNK